VDVFSQLSRELNVEEQQVQQALRLLGNGRSIPFIARYRKEATGGLNEQQLCVIEDAFAEVQRLEDRRSAIFKALDSKDIPESVLTAVRMCSRRAELEQLFLPWRSRRITRADTTRHVSEGWSLWHGYSLSNLSLNQRI